MADLKVNTTFIVTLDASEAGTLADLLTTTINRPSLRTLADRINAALGRTAEPINPGAVGVD